MHLLNWIQTDTRFWTERSTTCETIRGLCDINFGSGPVYLQTTSCSSSCDHLHFLNWGSGQTANYSVNKTGRSTKWFWINDKPANWIGRVCKYVRINAFKWTKWAYNLLLLESIEDMRGRQDSCSRSGCHILSINTQWRNFVTNSIFRQGRGLWLYPFQESN